MPYLTADVKWPRGWVADVPNTLDRRYVARVRGGA
jgi:hypothetical protein